LNPPDHAVVFSVDEKTAIQALDRLDLDPRWETGDPLPNRRHGPFQPALARG
jgi:hypothetical protein